MPGRAELLQLFFDLDADGDGWLTYEEAEPFLAEQRVEPALKTLGPKGGCGGS